VVQALLAELAEPILSSTLILPGDDAPLNDADAIRSEIGNLIDLVIDAGACAAEPTTVVDLSALPGVIVRQGGGDPAALGM
jgi:tRNA A37 threonylcarbamoyladenosine synthetase subunit TsaC/SUA5/YrdC